MVVLLLFESDSHDSAFKKHMLKCKSFRADREVECRDALLSSVCGVVRGTPENPAIAARVIRSTCLVQRQPQIAFSLGCRVLFSKPSPAGLAPTNSALLCWRCLPAMNCACSQTNSDKKALLLKAVRDDE
jgi:hypothetical protein